MVSITRGTGTIGGNATPRRSPCTVHWNEPTVAERKLTRMARKTQAGGLLAAIAALLVATLLITAPVIAASGARAETVLRVTVSGDLTNLDPMTPATTATLIHAMLVYDTLYAQDEQLNVHPQMIGAQEISADRLSFRLTLRPGLSFHDGTKVTTRDVVASLRRWSPLDVVARSFAAEQPVFEIIDDATFAIRLQRPFPVELALANNGSGMPVIMREKEALAGPFSKDTEIIGSGPFRFDRARWIAGAKDVYPKFANYVPRDEPPNGLAGGKIAKVDAVEVLNLPDSATKAAALQSGEIDFVDQVPFDQALILEHMPNITVASASTFNPVFIRPNTLYPPFNDPRARQALALMIDQTDYMIAAFADPRWGKNCDSFFVCGSPNGVTDGSEPYRKQDIGLARMLLAETGYKGEPVVLATSHEVTYVGVIADVLADNLRRIGVNVDMADSDYGTFSQRRVSKNPPDKGGWNLFAVGSSGSAFGSPLSNPLTDTTCGAKNYAGWACDEEAAALRQQWLHEADPDKQREILRQFSRRLWQVMPAIILGQRAQLFAWRDNVTGFVRSPSLATVFWNIEKH
jgi:peptide/nickel transport system substrate-binding protein